MEACCVTGWWYVSGIERRLGYHVQSPRYEFLPFEDDRVFQQKADAEARLADLRRERTFQIVGVYQVAADPETN